MSHHRVDNRLGHCETVQNCWCFLYQITGVVLTGACRLVCYHVATFIKNRGDMIVCYNSSRQIAETLIFKQEKCNTLLKEWSINHPSTLGAA